MYKGKKISKTNFLEGRCAIRTRKGIETEMKIEVDIQNNRQKVARIEEGKCGASTIRELSSGDWDVFQKVLPCGQKN